MANQEHKEWLLWLGPGATVLSGLIVPRPVRERRSGHVGVASARNVGEKALPPRLTVHGQAGSRPSRQRSRQALPWHQFMGCSGLAGQGHYEVYADAIFGAAADVLLAPPMQDES